MEDYAVSSRLVQMAGGGGDELTVSYDVAGKLHKASNPSVGLHTQTMLTST